MKDVARLAGVSPMTVSRALRSPNLVSPAILARVQATIERCGYVPNRVAGNLSSNRTTLVALIVPSLRNALYVEMIQGLSDVLTPRGYHLLISDSGYSLKREEELIAAHAAQRVCGLVLHNTRHTPRAAQILSANAITCVETGDLGCDPVDVAVSYSNHAAGAAMADHLVALGYRHMGFASLPVRGNDRLLERRRGFLTRLRALGFPVDPALVLEVGPGLASGSQALAHILQTDPDVDAVFFAGDVLAAGAIFECQRRGLDVPGRIAVAASDDNDLMQHTLPPLTTVRFPRYEIGVRAAEIIIARSAGRNEDEPRKIDMGFEVIRRGST